MQLIGLLGGMSWESTAEYYRLINRQVRSLLGGLRSARILLYSVDFEPISRLQQEEEWEEAAEILVDGGKRLEAGGAEILLLCTNTMHKVAVVLETELRVPLLHIADATASRVREAGLESVGLLGTRFTMEEQFYRERLEVGRGLEVLVPPESDRDLVHAVIYEELCRGEVRASSRAEYSRIIERMVAEGAEGVILGCTEIGLLIRQVDSPVPVFDTTRIQAETAVARALGL